MSRASSLGVERADRMTRPELRDEILRRTKSGVEAAEARGLFGIARSMLASMMETGLKMPEAAALIRGTQTLSAQVATSPPVATVTLAEIYAAQGHPDRALTMIERVLESEPDHLEARRLRDRLAEAQSSSSSSSTSLAVRADPEPAVLETTGEEIQTGPPPAVALRPEEPAVPEAASAEPSPAVPEAASAEPGPAVPEAASAERPRDEPSPMQAVPEPVLGDRGVSSLGDARASVPSMQGELGMVVEGAELVLRYQCSTETREPSAVALAPFVTVVGFRAQRGRPYVEEARVPLAQDSQRSAWSGSVRLNGFSGASVTAALGFMRDDRFVPLAQATLARSAWRSDSALEVEQG